MLSRLNRYYLIIGVFTYIVFYFSISYYFVPLFMAHFFTIIIYYLTLNHFSRQRSGNHSKEVLLSIVFIYSSFFVALYLYLSNLIAGNFFVFSEIDAAMYYREAMIMASKSVVDGINHFLNYWSYEDLGAVLVSSTLYRLIASKIFLNFFYIISGLIAAFGIYRISSRFMSQKYAFVSAIAYSLSSFVLWFHSSGLKESVMCTLIVLFFDQYYLYTKDRKNSHFFTAVLLITSLSLFRPVIIFLCLASIGAGILLYRKKGLIGFLILITIFISTMLTRPVVESQFERFAKGGDFSAVIGSRESMIVKNIYFTYFTNFVSLSIGPFPTLSPDVKDKLSFFSAGLMFKVLLSIPFWLGVYYIFKKEVDQLYPLVFFVFFESVALLSIIEGLELRNSLPHFFVFYIIGFWFMDQFDRNIITKKRQAILTIFNCSVFVSFCLILLWNFRYGLI